MTEAEWLSCANWSQMFDRMAGFDRPPSERKQRLLLAGCVRQVWDQIPPGHMREAVETAEQYADGAATAEDLRTAHSRYFDVAARGELKTMVNPQLLFLAYAASASIRSITRPHSSTHAGGLNRFAGQALPDLIRCVVGNLFRPIDAVPGWLAPTAVDLAAVIYADRAFDRLPILADALEEAGCTDPAVLSHGRSPGPHVRGCWVVDLVLGKG